MELFEIQNCRSSNGCPRAVADTSKLQDILEKICIEADFTNRRQENLGVKAKQHHVFRACLAGCANGCSQPQIKDFALMAKVLPVFNDQLCTLCGACCTACKEDALKIQGEKLIFDSNKCLGCGDCWSACATGAITPGKDQWRLLLGGKLGRHPQIAQEIACISEEKAIEYFKKAINIVLNSESPHKRFADLIKNNPLK